MKILLDTHIFLWWVTDDARLSKNVRQIIADKSNSLYFSSASGWEIVIKAQLGRLNLPKNPDKFITDQLNINKISVLPIKLEHVLYIYKLAPLHKDPFDRVLVAQSFVEKLPITTADKQISRYGVEIVW
ncbi:twitching motility protein PilT [candidate division KSB1 bacterium RBG_16_48_16]|nr:MAG: twitching motility protein PilT [candidate division KSB1 bacterium RBG_16_48_16]